MSFLKQEKKNIKKARGEGKEFTHTSLFFCLPLYLTFRNLSRYLNSLHLDAQYHYIDIITQRWRFQDVLRLPEVTFSSLFMSDELLLKP